MTEFYPANNFYYISFEDERLFDFPAENFNMYYQTLVELFGSHKTFIIDEIQNIPNFERFVRRFMEEGFKFFITGSNATLLSREIGSKLSGRHIDLYLTPFTFNEFLSFHGFSFKHPYQYSTEIQAQIKNFFLEYLEYGGIPEYLQFNDPDILKTIYDDIIYKDIAIRYNITNVQVLRELYRYLISITSNLFSYNFLKNHFKVGSVNTIKDYVAFLEESFLITRDC